MSGESYRQVQAKNQATCWLCGRMLKEGYHFVCHVCGATYCYSHMPDKCAHNQRRQPQVLRVPPQKA